MGRLARIADACIEAVERAIERFGDPDRVRALEEALRNADRATSEFARESMELQDELEREREAHAALRRSFNDVACALGVEGEPDWVVISTAWGKVGEVLGLRERVEELQEMLP